MDFAVSDDDRAFRAEARAWLEAHVPQPALPSLDTAQGFAAHRAWEATMAADRWSVVSWPAAYGGRDASLWQWLIFEEEYYRAGGPPRVGQNGIFLLAPTMFEFATPEQKARYLPPMGSGVEIWAQGWSEPDAGSDLAGIRTRARRVPGGWRLDGQKTWCSRAVFADWIAVLCRTDPDAERHRGLSYLLTPLDAPGVEIRPIPQLDGEPGFADVFFDDVFVPDDQVLGEVNQGWSVAMATASSERSLSLRSPGRFMATAQRLLERWRHCDDDALAAELADEVAQCVIDADAYRLATFGAVTGIVDGRGIGPEASANKVFWSELDLQMHELGLALAGPLAELAAASPDAFDGARWLDGWMFGLAGPIYAGTNEIQRDVIADRVLGLPRNR
ncbi:MAG: acyl-CoA dehydrogenase family protein [Acidimicrobiales bacterium]|nr:acyl-CoA dehydrogenase family protein [Acidimicrobiales bacterium]